MPQSVTGRLSSTPEHCGTHFSFHVPPPGEGENAAAEEVTAKLFQRASSSIERTAKRAAEMGKVRADWRAAIDKQIGLDNWRRFMDYSRMQRASNYGLQDPRPGEVAPDRIAAAKKEARRRSFELLNEAKVDRDALRKTHVQAEEKLLRILGPPETEARRIEVVREEDVPASIREGKTNPWFLKKPPYDGTYGLFDAYTWGGTVAALTDNIEIQYGLQYPGPYITGQFGHYSRYENFDCGDFDVLSLSAFTEIGFWYKPPQPGQRQVWIKIRCRRARGDIYLDDEYGISSSHTYMWSLLRFNVLEVPGLEGQTGDWSLHVPGSPDSTWYHLDWIAPDAVLWLPFTANFPPGWVYIGIGADEFRVAKLNDVSTSQAMDSRYLAEEVWIET
jgi:hypothetical protein